MRRIARWRNRVLRGASILWLCGVVAALVACRDAAPAAIFDEDIDSPSVPVEQLKGHISIEHLKTLAKGDATTIVSDIYIEGYVVANDLYGEYYKSIVLCDESGGIEISIDSRDLAVLFPLSARVVVHCSSLALGDYGGQLTLGAQPTADYSVDRIAELDIARYFTIDKSAPRVIKPQKVAIAELGPSLVGDYVMLEGVTFGTQAGMTWCDKDVETGDFITTKRLLTDGSGEQIMLTFIASCTYAAETIPSGEGAVCGIVEFFNGEYSLRVINRMLRF